MTRPFFTKPLFSFFFISLLLSGCSQNAIQPEQPAEHSQPIATLVTAVPVIASLSEELTENTGIEVRYLPPKRYSIKRIAGWLKRQDINAFPVGDLVVGIASVWPDLDIYPAIRQTNIRAVPVDVANALVPGGERVALANSDSESPNYFWLNPSNALIMLGILNRDLSRFVNTGPESEQQKATLIAQLQTNMQRMSESLRQSQLSMDEVLGNSAFMQIATDSREVNALASATLFPTATLEEAKTSQMPTILLTKRKVGHKLFKQLPHHIKVWYIDDFSKVKAGSFTERWQNNVNAIPH